MRIVKIQRVVQIARILPRYMLKRETYEESQRAFYNLVSGRQRSRELIKARLFFG